MENHFKNQLETGSKHVADFIITNMKQCPNEMLLEEQLKHIDQLLTIRDMLTNYCMTTSQFTYTKRAHVISTVAVSTSDGIKEVVEEMKAICLFYATLKKNLIGTHDDVNKIN